MRECVRGVSVCVVGARYGCACWVWGLGLLGAGMGGMGRMVWVCAVVWCAGMYPLMRIRG